MQSLKKKTTNPEDKSSKSEHKTTKSCRVACVFVCCSLTFMLTLIAMGVSIDYMAHSGRAYHHFSVLYSDPDKARTETTLEVRYVKKY